MVLEQGALTGKYDTEHPFPEDSDRGRTYNPMLPKLEKLNKELEKIADRHHMATAQIPIAWAIAKGTLPIFGVTKVYQVEDAVKAAAVELSPEEIEEFHNAVKALRLCDPMQNREPFPYLRSLFRQAYIRQESFQRLYKNRKAIRQ